MLEAMLAGVLILTLALLGGAATGWAADPQEERWALVPALFPELEAVDTALLAAPGSQPGAGTPGEDHPWLRAHVRTYAYELPLL